MIFLYKYKHLFIYLLFIYLIATVVLDPVTKNPQQILLLHCINTTQTHTKFFLLLAHLILR